MVGKAQQIDLHISVGNVVAVHVIDAAENLRKVLLPQGLIGDARFLDVLVQVAPVGQLKKEFTGLVL